MKNVENKVVIITGASSGIGEETAWVLAQNGARVVLSARRRSGCRSLQQSWENMRFYGNTQTENFQVNTPKLTETQEPLILFFLDSLAVMGLFVWIGHYLAEALKYALKL